MVAFTPNYNLGKPSGAVGGDFVDVNVLDANMDTIDTALHAHDLQNTSQDSRLTVLEAAPGGQPDVCNVYKNASQSIPANVLTFVTWDTETEDPAGFHGVGGASFIVPAGKAGLYLIMAKIRWAVGGTGVRDAYLMLNAGTLMHHQAPAIIGASPTACNDFNFAARLAVGDSLHIEAFQSSAGALNCVGYAIGEPNYFQLIRIGV